MHCWGKAKIWTISGDTGNRDTKRAGIYCTFAMYSLRGESHFPGVILFVYISAGAPFLSAIDADLQRFYKEYFDDNDSEDNGILFPQRFFVG